MKNVSTIIACLIACACPTFAALPAGWDTDFTNALKKAQAQQQPVLAYFTASWCGPCKMMTRTTLTNETVLQALNNFSHVAVDIDDHQELAKGYDVRAVPTFHILTPAGDKVSTTTGYQDAARFLTWLTNGVSEAKETVTRRKESEEKLAGIDQLLRQTDLESLKKAAAETIDLCAERENSVVEAASERLVALAKRNPALLLDGLNHPRLAARIQVANAMRTQLGESFDVDPWSDTTARQQAINRWRDKLAGQNLSSSLK